MKYILDACCGGRMFWFNKRQPNTIFIDNYPRGKGHNPERPNQETHPDVIMDNREMDFPDNSFKLIVFDPPHIIGDKERFSNSKIISCYGALDRDTWREDIKKGFDECWRVLEDYGVLIFKWNEASIKRKEILSVIGKEPLFGHQIRTKVPTHWFCFMKIPLAGGLQ